MKTTCNRKQLTRKQVFNKVKRHLLWQKKKSRDGAMCLYRHGKLKCAVGCLIPDELYDASIEGDAVDELMYKYNVLPSVPNHRDYEMLLKSLQHIHDMVNVENWPLVLESYAEDYDIKVTTMDRIIDSLIIKAASLRDKIGEWIG